jgi:hypothetical protein
MSMIRRPDDRYSHFLQDKTGINALLLSQHPSGTDDDPVVLLEVMPRSARFASHEDELKMKNIWTVSIGPETFGHDQHISIDDPARELSHGLDDSIMKEITRSMRIGTIILSRVKWVRENAQELILSSVAKVQEHEIGGSVILADAPGWNGCSKEVNTALKYVQGVCRRQSIRIEHCILGTNVNPITKNKNFDSITEIARMESSELWNQIVEGDESIPEDLRRPRRHTVSSSSITTSQNSMSDMQGNLLSVDGMIFHPRLSEEVFHITSPSLESQQRLAAKLKQQRRRERQADKKRRR